MKRFKLKMHSLWYLLFADEWIVYTKKNKDWYQCDRMIVGDILTFCAEKHSHYYNQIIDDTQADINIKTVNDILNSKQ